MIKLAYFSSGGSCDDVPNLSDKQREHEYSHEPRRRHEQIFRRILRLRIFSYNKT